MVRLETSKLFTKGATWKTLIVICSASLLVAASSRHSLLGGVAGQQQSDGTPRQTTKEVRVVIEQERGVRAQTTIEDVDPALRNSYVEEPERHDDRKTSDYSKTQDSKTGSYSKKEK